MIIPAEIDGAQVTEIVEDAFYDNNTITGVVFADGLRLIGDTSFYSTSKLSGTVTLPPSVKKVGSQAFLLSKLTAVNVLSDCSIGYRAFENTNAEFLYIREGCKASLGEASFAYNKELKTVVIPASVTSIDQTAFSNCPKMTIITPPGSFAETYAKLNMLPCNTKDYDQYVAQYEAMLLMDAAAALQ